MEGLTISHVVGGLGLGGAEQLVQDLAIEQSRRGYSVRVFSMSCPAASERYLWDDRVSALKANGVVVELLGASQRAVLRPSRELIRYRKTPDLGVIHAHLAVGSLVGRVAMGRRVPIIWTLHNTEVNFPRAFVPLTRSWVDEFVACSQAVARSWAELRLMREIRVIPNGVVTSEFVELAPAQPSGYGEFRLLAIGGMRLQKNYPLLVEAVARARRQLESLGIAVSLAIVGDGPERASVEAAVRRWNASSFVFLEGARTDLARYLESSHAFIMSSNHEGFPLALIEASAAGLPCIVTPFPTAQDELTGRSAQLISQTFAARDLSEKIVELATTPELYAAASQEARVRARTRDIASTASGYEELYLALSERKSQEC